MEVLLDSNFVISSIKRKIDFISDLELLGFKILLPREVYQELKDLRSKAKSEEKAIINMALKMIDSGTIKKTTLGNMSVDKGLIQKGRSGYYIATLDSGIKRMVPNKVLINNAQNKIVIERN